MTTLFCFASIRLRPNADHDTLTVGRSARDLLRKKIAPCSMEQKKNFRVVSLSMFSEPRIFYFIFSSYELLICKGLAYFAF